MPQVMDDRGQPAPAPAPQAPLAYRMLARVPELKQSQEMAQRSPVPQRGFDPARMTVSNMVPKYSGGVMSAGTYDPNADMTELYEYSDQAGRGTGELIGGPGTPVHEASHRGIRMDDRYVGGAAPGSAIGQTMASGQDEEEVIRTLDHRLAGTAPDDFERQHFPGTGSPERKGQLQRLEGTMSELGRLRRDAEEARRALRTGTPAHYEPMPKAEDGWWTRLARGLGIATPSANFEDAQRIAARNRKGS